MSDKPISDLRRRMLQDMAVRHFGTNSTRLYPSRRSLPSFSGALPIRLPATIFGRFSSIRSSKARSRRR